MRKIRTFLAGLILVAFFTTTIFSQYIAARPEDVTSGANDPKAREIIVKYKNQSKSEAVKSNAKKKAKLSKLKLKRKLKSTRAEVLEIGQKDDMGAALKELNSSPEVAYAQPNYKLTTRAFPADTYFNEQWGLYNNGQTVGGQAGLEGVDVNALQAWSLTQGSQSVVVGVMDTGIDINHPDLHSSIFVNPAEIAGNGVDDDGNGFIDDVNGWDFLNDDKTVYDSGAADVHGTHVAGIIAASADSQGIAGVAPKVRIMPLKFINDETGYTSDAIEAIEYAKLMGVKIVNCSWSGYDYNAALLDAMQNTDILFVCAAGNNGRNSSSMPNYPAGFDIPNVLSVAALDNKGKLASFSNFGSNVQVAAPGVNILSTLPENSYGYMSGTSMAAPHVTGIAALLKSYRQEMLFVDIAARIKANAVPMQTLEGKVSSGGRADAYAALNNSVLNYSNEAEPNNNWENATAIMAGKTNGSIAAIDDVDWFKLSLQEGKPVSIKLKGIPAGNDFDLELYTPDMSRADYSYNTKNSQETVGIVPEQSGTYYIRVKPHTFSGAGEQPYVLDMDMYNSIPGGNEPNDTKDTPTGILENKTYYSTIDYPGDVDWYAIEATRAGKLVTGLGQIPEGADYNVEIYAPNGDKLGGSYFGGNKEEKIDIMVNAPGRYLIKVYSEQQTTPEATYGIELKDNGTEYSVNRQLNPGASSLQPYELTTRLVVPDSYEENDSYRTARQISPTDTVSATIDNQKDEDWYRVEVSQLTSMYLKLSSIAAGLDYDLTLLDSRLDYVAGSFKRGSLSEDAFAELEPGTYYIKVDSYAGYSDKNAYRLILSPYKLDEYEINDTPEAARELAINRSINATIHNITDQDWYRFTFQQAGKLDIQLSNIPEGCNYELELYNQSLEKIDESRQAAGSDEVIWRDVPEGEYFIKVYTTGGFDCENGYMLTVNRNIGLANALSISENSTSTGKISQDSGSNWYKTSVTQTGVFTLSLDNIPENCYYKLELYDADGYKLAKSENVSESQQSLDFMVQEPGDLYIKVYSLLGYNDAVDYTLTSKLTPVADLEVPEKVAEGVDLGEDTGDGEAQANGAESGGEAAGLTARLPQEITQRADFSPDSMGTSTAEGFKVSLDEARLPEKRSTIKAEGFTGIYTQETERNDLTINVDGKDEATHQLKQLNVIVSGSLSSADTNDYYLFSNNNQRGKYIVEIDNSPTGGNLKLYFTGVNWGGQYYLSDGVNHDAYVAALVTDPAPQYYVIRVIGSGITSGSVAYKLKVTFMPEDFVSSHDPGEMGNNDSFSGARYISRSTSGDNINYTAQEATLDFRNDYDTYRISLDSGHKFTAILKSPLEHGNYYYVLLDSSYKEVQDNLYNGQDQTGAACYELLYNVPVTGTYYLLVFSDENKYYDVFNKYKLEFYSSKNNEAMEYNSSVKNFNNAWEFASSISLNTAYTCKLDSPFDCDVYSISIPSEGKLTVNLDKKGFGDNYSLMVKDLDSTIYEYINSKTDYVFYAPKSGTYKLAVVRRNPQSPASMSYGLAAAFTPKSGFDTYENTSTVTPVKNVDFLKSNNQYLRVNGSSTNLTDISNQQARSLNMDNRYDVDWFKIDTSKTGSGQNSAKISLTGIPAGDDYNLVVVDSAGNVIGSSNKTSNQSEALNFMINKAANSYYYVCVYANTYGASTHSASLSFSTVAESTAVYVSDIGIQNTGEEYLEDLAAETGATLSGNTVYYMNRSMTYGSSNSRVVNGKLVVNAYDFAAYFVDKNTIRQQLIALDPGLFDGDIGIAAVSDIIQVAVLYEKSENVRNIQRLLQKLGCWVDKNGNRSKANATGYYGETTQASLIKFQKEYMSKSDQSVIRQSVTREMAQLLSVNYSITFGIENAYQNSSSIKTAKENLARLGYGGKLKSYYYDPAAGKTVYGYSGQWSYDFNDALWNFTTDYGYKNTYINNGFNKAVLYKWIQDAADRIGNANPNAPYYDNCNDYTPKDRTATAQVSKSFGLGVLAAILNNGLDDINNINAVITSIFGSNSDVQKAYQSVSYAKQDFLNRIYSMVTNDQAYYAGKTLTDIACVELGVLGTVEGLKTFLAGLTGDAASAIIEGLSLGTGTPVLAITAAISTVVAAVGAVEIGVSVSLAVAGVGNGINDLGSLKNAILKWKSKVTANEIRAVDDSTIYDMLKAEDGHLLENHSSMTNEELISRSFYDDVSATSFENQSTAIRAVKENLRSNADAIADWINNSNTGKKAFSVEHANSVGYGAYSKTKQVTNGLTKSLVVLIRDPQQALGFRILTGYPLF